MSRVPVPPGSPRPRSAPRRFRPRKPDGYGYEKFEKPDKPTTHTPRSSRSRGKENDHREETEKENVLGPLMKAIAGLCQHRDRGTELWFRLLEPLRRLVLCEEVKIVVRCLGPLPPDPLLPFNHDVEARRRVCPVTFVETWPAQRIEGYAALTQPQSIQVMPSPLAARHNWDRYEMVQPHCTSALCCKASEGLRCLAAVPLLDAGGNVLAVAKFFNRRKWADGQWHPCFKFSEADLNALRAFAAIFACVAPYPFLALLAAPLEKPQVKVFIDDYGIHAQLWWQVPYELGRGPLSHEVFYGPVEHDEFECCTSDAEAKTLWRHVSCGFLSPLEDLEDEDLTFEFSVPIQNQGVDHTFRVRCRNQHTSLDWSEPSLQVSTCIEPPYAEHKAVRMIPMGENTLQLLWTPFTRSGGISLVEYRVLAQAESSESVVACFVSNGTTAQEEVTVSCLPNVSYTFAIEARYPFIGSRVNVEMVHFTDELKGAPPCTSVSFPKMEFSRSLTSDRFCYQTADVSLPAPQPLALDSTPVEVAGTSEGTIPVVLRWPYPKEFSGQLLLQYREALPERGGDRCQVSLWHEINPNAYVQAELRSNDEATQVRVLRLKSDAPHAIQLRVLLPRDRGTASPPSAWFYPLPPPTPSELKSRLAFENGFLLRVSWEQKNNSAVHGELGPVAGAIQHDFARGNGPIATRFQARIRTEGVEGAKGAWEVLEPQLLPRLRQVLDREAYEWSLHDVRLATGPLEVQLRHANAILWSSWSDSSIIPGAESPVPVGTLEIEELTPDSVRLCWPAFISPLGLPLEYRVQCSDGDVWQTVSVVEDMRDGDDLQCVVKFLNPHCSYSFSIQCRYRALPTFGARLKVAQLGRRECAS
ncbi:unnamed protein product [Durusdinium trenchii]|uniref:Uncharacterized protein n=2 Tax=Durusdinium trenchii TaxID=1381693 RepID=A0ABP0QS06_9DINO